jgi:phage anti-repressor protein
MKKTAMQELIDWAISLQYKQQQCIDWIVIKDKAESLLAMEKEQIEDAYFIGGRDIQINRYRGMHEYYNETYGGNNEK